MLGVYGLVNEGIETQSNAISSLGFLDESSPYELSSRVRLCL